MAMATTAGKAVRMWARRFGALVVWGYIICFMTSLHQSLPLPTPIRTIYSQEYRWARYLCCSLIVLLAFRRYGIKPFLYLGTFPIWAPAVFMWNGLKIVGLVIGIVFRVLGLNVKLFQTAASKRAGAACYGLMPLCYFAIHDSTNSSVVFVSIAVLVLLSYRIIYGVFRWAMKPLASVSAILIRMKEQTGKEVQSGINEIRVAQEKRDFKSIKKKLETEQNWIKALEWLQRALLTPQRLLGLFFVVLAFSVSLIIINYATAYWGLNKIDPRHFQAMSDERGFWDFVYFGLMTMTTSDFSPLVPITATARWIAASQIICSVILLSMLVLAFTTSANTEVGEAASSLKDLLTTRRSLHTRLRQIENVADADVTEVETAGGDEGV